MRRSLLFMAFIVTSMWGVAAAQQDACKAFEIPVGVINFGGESFRGLAPQDFVARAQKGSVAIKSIAYDDSPRRILLVVDTSKKLSANLRKAELELVKSLVASARPEDTLGLLTARGPGGAVKFGDPRANIVDAIAQETNSKEGKDRGVLDTVLEGTEWFSPSHPGDAIVVIAHDTEGNHKANAKAVAKALADHHVRMFGLALGPIQTRNSTTSAFYTSATQGLSLATPSTGDILYNTGDEDFYPLTMNSGGLVGMVMDPDSKQFSDKMDDPRVQQRVKLWAQTITNATDSFYRMTVEPQHAAHGEWWDLQLTEGIQKNSPKMWLLFPHSLGPC